MEIREVMTESVVTAAPDAPVREVAELMRERNVGSVVLVDATGCRSGSSPTATWRSAWSPTATTAGRPRGPRDRPGRDRLARPGRSRGRGADGRHGIRRLPIVDGDRLIGIVTLDDLAVRIGDLEIAPRSPPR